MAERSFRVLVVGAGPAGLAPLLAAHRRGRLDALLAQGVAVVEATDRPGGGDLGRYAINSDSTGHTFVDCLKGPRETALTRLADHPVAVAVARCGDGPVPLSLVGRFMSLVGETLLAIVKASHRSTVLLGHRVLSIRRDRAGWLTVVQGADGRKSTVRSRAVVSATGAAQPRERLVRQHVGGVPLALAHGPKLMQSGDVLAFGGLDEVAARLADRPDPRVAVVGGSTSAMAVAHALLHRLPTIRFGHGGVTVLHRRPLRVYYPDRDAALADGYDEWDVDDVCPVSGRVFRLAGFRLDSRELVMQARGIGRRAPEPRFALHQIAPGADRHATAILDRADVVVAALGYVPRFLPAFDRSGRPIATGVERGRALVDGQCRVLDATGAPVPDLYAIGLASGFLPRGALGGERSFRGQANGLWLWQNDVGAMIVDAVLASRDAATVHPIEPSLAVSIKPPAGMSDELALDVSADELALDVSADELALDASVERLLAPPPEIPIVALEGRITVREAMPA